MFNKASIASTLTAMLAVASAAGLAAQTDGAREHFTFTAANMSKAGPSTPARLNILITRWSTDADRDRVRSTLMEGGPAKLVHVFQLANEAGYIDWPGSGQYIVRYARRVPQPDGGEEIVLATERPMWWWWDTPPAGTPMDYPFTLVQLRLDKDGGGTGKLSLTSGVVADQRAGVVLDSYASQPVLLSDVRRERSGSRQS
jgi:hypothetical protein